MADRTKQTPPAIKIDVRFNHIKVFNDHDELTGFDRRGAQFDLHVELPERMVDSCLNELKEMLERWQET